MLSIDTVIRVICEKELEVGSFEMGFQEYKEAWPSLENKKLNTRMEPESKKRQIYNCCHWRERSCCWPYSERENSTILKNNFLFLTSKPISQIQYSNHWLCSQSRRR